MDSIYDFAFEAQEIFTLASGEWSGQTCQGGREYHEVTGIYVYVTHCYTTRAKHHWHISSYINIVDIICCFYVSTPKHRMLYYQSRISWRFMHLMAFQRISMVIIAKITRYWGVLTVIIQRGIQPKKTWASIYLGMNKTWAPLNIRYI